MYTKTEDGLSIDILESGIIVTMEELNDFEEIEVSPELQKVGEVTDYVFTITPFNPI